MKNTKVAEHQIIRLFLAAVCLLFSLMFLSNLRSYAETFNVNWSKVELDNSGNASWQMEAAPGSLSVDKYELKLARKSNGNWNTNYKTVKCNENSYEFSFSSTGQYYYTVRAVFVGGDTSSWSLPSTTVSVASSDIEHESNNNNSGAVYIQTVGANGQIYYQQAGPGIGVQLQTSTIGPNGNYVKQANNGVITNQPVGGQVVVNQVVGGPTISNQPQNQTITGNNGASGWVRDGNRWRYRYANNTYAANSWEYINNKWYYFDQYGYMSTGWIYYNSNWYLCDSSGERQTGWNMVNNKWYYLNGGGIMQTGYIVVDGITYYCDNTGAKFTGGYNPDGHYFDESGVMIK